MRTLPFLLLLVACCDAAQDTSEVMDNCSTDLTYQNFGESFLITWCRGCHSATVPEDMRQMAPPTVNYNSLADAKRWRSEAISRVSNDGPLARSMPPSGGPSDGERALFVEWMKCAKELK